MATIAVLCRVVGWASIALGVFLGAATVWDVINEPIPLRPTGDGESDAWGLFFTTFILMAAPILVGIVALWIGTAVRRPPAARAPDDISKPSVDRD